jgi:predicted dehydrogenase
VLGTGWIADRFVRSLRRHTRQQVLAVGSRDAGRSAAFAGRHGLPRAHGSYEDLVAGPDVDVVYVATAHPAHHPCATLALEAGKHTVVEKPLALNADQAADIARLAAGRGRFCMEALWTFFLPKFDIVRQLLDAGALGEVRTVRAEYGEHFTAEHRILRPDLAGGPLLDLGTYPVSLATWVLGPPARVLAAGQPHPAGVNGQAAAILCDPRGNQAVLHTTLLSNTPTTAPSPCLAPSTSLVTCCWPRPTAPSGSPSASPGSPTTPSTSRPPRPPAASPTAGSSRRSARSASRSSPSRSWTRSAGSSASASRASPDRAPGSR